jgi:hypothetical protein
MVGARLPCASDGSTPVDSQSLRLSRLSRRGPHCYAVLAPAAGYRVCWPRYPRAPRRFASLTTAAEPAVGASAESTIGYCRQSSYGSEHPPTSTLDRSATQWWAGRQSERIRVRTGRAPPRVAIRPCGQPAHPQDGPRRARPFAINSLSRFWTNCANLAHASNPAPATSQSLGLGYAPQVAATAEAAGCHISGTSRIGRSQIPPEVSVRDRDRLAQVAATAEAAGCHISASKHSWEYFRPSDPRASSAIRLQNRERERRSAREYRDKAADSQATT